MAGKAGAAVVGQIKGRRAFQISRGILMNILVVGGAGYIGSHMVKRLGQLRCEVTTLEN
jgi:predicted ATPase with chaperone activity